MSIVQIISTHRTGDIRILTKDDQILEASADTDHGKDILEDFLRERNNIFYTLENPESYDKAIANGKRAKKLGREPGYIGGSIFRTKELAFDYIRKK